MMAMMADSAQITKYAAQIPAATFVLLYMSKEPGPNSQDDTTGSPIEQEIKQRLQGQLALIEALEARNEAQLGSFIDQQNQRDSLEEEERQLLQSKDVILLRRIEVLLSQALIQMWMYAG
jgi:hypothetical protein